MRVIEIRPLVAGMTLVPRDVEPGAYVSKAEYDRLKEMYDNLLYASERLCERRSRPTKPEAAGEVREVRMGVSEGGASSVQDVEALV